MTSSGGTVVKTYGRDSALIAWNPILSALMSSLGMRVGLFTDEQLRERMEKDALDMLRRGYRVVATEELRMPLLLPVGQSSNYYRVTYQRQNGSVAGKPSVG